MAQRLASLPLSPINIKKEMSTISAIARSNGLNVDVNKIVYKRRRALARKRGTSLNTLELPSEEKIRWVRLPFLGRSSHKLARILKNYGYKTAFYSLFTLRSISSPKDPTPLPRKTGVYKIECRDCDAVYIGQPGRALEERVAEHDSAVNAVNPPESAFARHIIATGHNKSGKTVSLLHYSPKGRVLNKLEEIEIIKHKKLVNTCTVLNDTEHVLFGSLVSYVFNYAHESP